MIESRISRWPATRWPLLTWNEKTRRGRCDEALDSFGRMHPSGPAVVPALLMSAECHERRGRIVEAGRSFEAVLKIEPDNELASKGLVRCLEALGEHGKAAEARERFGVRE